MPCATHRRIIDGLDRLADDGVIDPDTRNRAVAATDFECDYQIQEHDDAGNCVLRHP